jgi:hypothetical protein
MGGGKADLSRAVLFAWVSPAGLFSLPRIARSIHLHLGHARRVPLSYVLTTPD